MLKTAKSYFKSEKAHVLLIDKISKKKTGNKSSNKKKKTNFKASISKKKVKNVSTKGTISTMRKKGSRRGTISITLQV